MSYVTNVILTVDLADDRRLDDVNAFFDHLPLHQRLRRVHDEAGGNKALEVEIWVGAFNYLDVENFIAHLKSGVRWEDPDGVRLLLKDGDDDAVRIVENVP